MTHRTDLTRWNRAGLSRFRYVDGNAATYLETLRLAMQAAFADPAVNPPQWQSLDIAVAADESEADRLTRLLGQYQASRRDLGWEIMRTLARSVHIIAEHLDAYANEAYLDTATQWDAVRRLVAMLDYHPAPPASAEGLLRLTVKNGQKGRVATGFQVKNAPADGSTPVIFETLADLDVDAALNSLRLRDWNRSQAPFAYVAKGKGGNICLAAFPIGVAIEGLSQGGKGILLVEADTAVPQGIPIRVTHVAADRLVLEGPPPPDGIRFPVRRHQVSLLVMPEHIQAPQLIGDDALRLDRDHNLSADTKIAWQEGGTWYAARVANAQGRRLVLADGEPGHRLPPIGKAVYRLHSAGRQEVASGSRLAIPVSADRRSGTAVWSDTLARISTDQIEPFTDSANVTLFEEVTTAGIETAHYLSSETDHSGVVRDRQLQTLTFDGDPGDLASGQWVYLEDQLGQPHARQIDSLEKIEDAFRLELLGTPLDGTLRRLYGTFAETVQPADADKNRMPVLGSVLPLAIDPLPAGLTKGRPLIIQGDRDALAVTVSAVDPAARTVTVTPAISPEEVALTRYATVIAANVVAAGHGESKPEAILGSGDAAQSNQSFVFKIKEIAFVADTGQPAGVAAAIAVRVDGRTWRQVGTLKDAGPAEASYTVRMTEEGYLKIAFGDGMHGRRLPTGQNNLRIAYRVGTGPTGNLAPGGLSKAVAPHPLLDAVSQPLATGGGNLMEAVADIRSNAPASVLTLERAVSLADFTHLATAHSSVWQALAVASATGFSRHENVLVVVVPAGGVPLGSLKGTLEDYLSERALPGVSVEVVPYAPVALKLAVVLRVPTEAYDPDTVAAAVREALTASFSLKQARLGKVLYRSAVVQAAETVTGVQNCLCVIRADTLTDAEGNAVTVRHVARGADGTIRSIRPTADQVIYLEETPAHLEITVEEFSL
jgi:hypothetical protein